MKQEEESERRALALQRQEEERERKAQLKQKQEEKRYYIAISLNTHRLSACHLVSLSFVLPRSGRPRYFLTTNEWESGHGCVHIIHI